MCGTCGRPAAERKKLNLDQNGCRRKRGRVWAPTLARYADGGHRLWVLGDWIWCTKCGGYANRVPRKFAKRCTAQIENCGKNTLRWFRVGRCFSRTASSHPSGQSGRGRGARSRPAGRHAPTPRDCPWPDHRGRAEFGASRKLATTSDPFAAADTESCSGDEVRNSGAPLWPRHGDRLAWAVSVRAF